MTRRARSRAPEAFADQVDDVMLFDGLAFHRVSTTAEIHTGLDAGMVLSVLDAAARAAPFIVVRPFGTAFYAHNEAGEIGTFLDFSAAITAGLKHGLGAGLEH